MMCCSSRRRPESEKRSQHKRAPPVARARSATLEHLESWCDNGAGEVSVVNRADDVEDELVAPLHTRGVRRQADRVSQQRLADFRAAPGGAHCADCGRAGPTWGSSAVGALICTQCSGVHRMLGVEYSKVLSVSVPPAAGSFLL